MDNTVKIPEKGMDQTINSSSIEIDPLQQRILSPKFIDRWREALAYIFSIIILYDFVIAPLFVQIADGVFKASLPIWTSLTLQNGGLFYIAMATILGVSAWGKFSETSQTIKNMPDYSKPNA